MFEWDETKRLKTLHNRHLDFKDAWQVFDGRPVVHLPSFRNDESRFISISEINGAFYTVVWMWRGQNKRIISFRRARNAEERAYRKAHV